MRNDYPSLFTIVGLPGAMSVMPSSTLQPVSTLWTGKAPKYYTFGFNGLCRLYPFIFHYTVGLHSMFNPLRNLILSKPSDTKRACQISLTFSNVFFPRYCSVVFIFCRIPNSDLPSFKYAAPATHGYRW